MNNLPNPDAKRKPIVDECSKAACPKIWKGRVCCTYIDPAAIQNRCGRNDACGIMPRPDKAAIKKSTLKRKFGSRTR